MSSKFTRFDDKHVVGKLPPAQAAVKLRAVGEIRIANNLESLTDEKLTLSFWPFGGDPPAWIHTTHTFGHIPLRTSSDEFLPITYVGDMDADQNLKNQRVTIRLDRIRVANYPGSGKHQILFDFSGQHHEGDDAQDLHFSQTFTAEEGEQVPIIGYPIFKGISVGTEGISFACKTINVKNQQDEAFLGFLKSDVFTKGLHLLTTFQPAIAPLSGLAVGIAESIAKRNENIEVQAFYMGLNFNTVPTEARLAEGSYLAVQIPEAATAIWDWKQWVYDAKKGNVVSTNDHTKLIPYNYIVFGISKHEGT